MEKLSTEQLSTLQQKLNQQKKHLTYSLHRLADSCKPVPLDQQAQGRVTRIDAIQQQKMASANQSAQEASLKLTLQALHRLETNDYGYCERCDDLIYFARLEIKPEAKYCIKCQSTLETPQDRH